MARFSLRSDSSHALRGPGLRGGKASKRKCPTPRPESARAVGTAEGPGKQVTGISRSAAADTRDRPGSEIIGIPASVTTRTVPDAAASISCWARSFSLWSKLDTTRPEISIPKAWARLRTRRVSSAAMTSACCKACIKRAEASPTFPSGVAARITPRGSGSRPKTDMPLAFHTL